MQHILPEKVCWRRDKMGFQTPENLWLQAAGDKIRELFSISNLRCRKYLDQKAILSNFDKYLDRQTKGDNQIWRWINLEYWMEQFDLS